MTYKLLSGKGTLQIYFYSPFFTTYANCKKKLSDYEKKKVSPFYDGKPEHDLETKSVLFSNIT